VTAGIRGIVEHVAGEAGVNDQSGFAREWHLLMKDSIVAAGEGDRKAARCAKEMARILLTQKWPNASASR